MGCGASKGQVQVVVAPAAASSNKAGPDKHENEAHVKGAEHSSDSTSNANKAAIDLPGATPAEAAAGEQPPNAKSAATCKLPAIGQPAAAAQVAQPLPELPEPRRFTIESSPHALALEQQADVMGASLKAVVDGSSTGFETKPPAADEAAHAAVPPAADPWSALQSQYSQAALHADSPTPAGADGSHTPPAVTAATPDELVIEHEEELCMEPLSKPLSESDSAARLHEPLPAAPSAAKLGGWSVEGDSLPAAAHSGEDSSMPPPQPDGVFDEEEPEQEGGKEWAAPPEVVPAAARESSRADAAAAVLGDAAPPADEEGGCEMPGVVADDSGAGEGVMEAAEAEAVEEQLADDIACLEEEMHAK